MKHFLIGIFALLLSSASYAQLDEKGKQFLDSLGIKFDPNDPDAERKIGQQIKDKFLAKYDSAIKVAENTVIDPENTKKLLADILDEFGDEDSTSTSFEFMQVMPVLEINLDHPDPRFLTADGFDLPNNLEMLIISGNGKAIPVDLNSLFTKLSSRYIRELYITKDKEGISEIPDNIGELKDLKKLGLYGNNIAQLPASIGQLTQLEVLYIDGNPIHQLPETISGLKELKVLGIAKTQISAEEQARLQKQLPNCKILLQ